MPLFSRRRGKPETAAPRPPEFHSAGAALLPSAKALIAAPLSFIECGLGGAVAAFDGEGEAVILDAAGASLLQALKRPCAPGELEDRLREQGWDGDDFEKAQAAIEGFEKGGLLRRLDGMIEEARSAPPALSGGVSAGPGLGLLAIPTRDRPATLERALAAWLSAVAGNENDSLPPDLMVVDDSLVDALATGSVVKAFAAVHRGATCLLDRSDRLALAKALAPAGGRAVAFALGLEGLALGGDGGIEGLGRYGAARNFILLASAGRPVAMVDDDILPDFRSHPEALAGLALSREPDPTIVRPFPDRKALEAWLPPSGGDIEAPHRLLLGRPLRELLLEAQVLDLAKADSATLDVALGREARVAALCFGTWGDSGIPTNRYLLALRRLVDTGLPDVYASGNYESAMAGRMIFRSPLRATIGGRTFMGGHIALDARTLLPPFSPWGRDEDGLWGFCLGILHPASLVAYPKEAVLHEPPNARASSREDALRWDLWLNETLRALLGTLSSRHESGDPAYVSLGGRLGAIASGPRRELRLALAESSARSMAARIGLLEHVLEEYHGEPAAWAADVEGTIAALASRLEEKRFWLPRELHGLDADRAEGSLADYLVRFGELLEAWPAIFKAAATAGPELLARAKVT